MVLQLIIMAELSIAPTFATSSGIGQIKYSAGAGDDGLKEIKKIEMTNKSTVFDGYQETVAITFSNGL